MRILQIVPEMNVGGVETGTLDIAFALQGQGHEVTVMSHGGALIPRLEQANIRHVQAPVHRKEPFTILRMAWFLRRFILQNRIDIVHARSRVPGWIAYLATRGMRAQFVTTAHGAYRAHALSRVMGWGEKVIVPSTAIWDRMAREFSVPESRLCLIPRGVDLKRFCALQRPRIPAEGPVCVGMVGRVTPIKGHEVFLRALALARQRQPRLRGLIVGDAPEGRIEIKQRLEALALELGLQGHVDFQPARPDVENVYARLDMLVMASVVPESFGRVLVEAQAAGIPVIASALGGILDIIEDGRTGTLFPAGDAAALAGAMLDAAAHPEKARAMADAAWQKAERLFTIEQMTRCTLGVYQEVAHPKNILVFKFSSLGDVLLAEASLRALRNRFPKARLSVLVKTPYVEVFKDCPHLDEVIEYDSEHQHKGPNLVSLAMELRERRFDLCVDLQNNWRSHAIGFLAGITRRIGYARKGGRLLFNEAVAEPVQKMDPVSHQFHLLKQLEIEPLPDGLRFYGTAEDEAWAAAFCETHGMRPGDRVAAVHVGGSTRWQSKQWGLDSFAALINGLHARAGLKPLLVGGQDDAALAAALRLMLKQTCMDAVGKTSLGRLAALLKRCSVLVSSDSAPLHVAAAVRLPFVALFGPTDPKRHAPQGIGRVLFKNPPCGPCYQPVCPEGHHRCMKDIALSEVVEAMQAVARPAAPAVQKQEALA